MRDRIRGAVYGHLVGDALGVPYEFTPADVLPSIIEWRGFGTHGQPPGTWSDDGALMLCLLASLADKGCFDPEDVGRRFLAWLDSGYMAAGGVVFDCGGTVRKAIERLRRGAEPLDAGPKDEWSNGNGSLMRILPLSLWASRLPLEKQIDLSHKGSMITHGHLRSQVCCAVYSVVARLILKGSHRKELMREALDLIQEVYAKDERWGESYLRELEELRTYTLRTGSGYVVDCLLSSMDALSSASSFEEAVIRAIRYGNDTDTTAAVTGGLAGLVFGLEGIPHNWISGLRLEREQAETIEKFASLFDDRTPRGP